MVNCNCTHNKCYHSKSGKCGILNCPCLQFTEKVSFMDKIMKATMGKK